MRRAVLPCLLAALLPAAGPAGAATGELRRSWSFQVQPGTRLVVDAADTDLRVRVGDVRRVMLSVDMGISGVTERQARTWIEHHTPVFSEEPGRLGVTLRPASRGVLGHVTSRAHLSIVAPPGLVPDLTTTSGDIELWGDFPEADPLYLRTLSGTITWTGASRSVDARSTTGAIRLRVVRPLERFTASTSGGDVELEGGARNVKVDTSSGRIILEGLSGPAKIGTASGKVFLSWDRAAPGTTVRVRSITGPVRVLLPHTATPTGELRTTGGEIHCNLPGASATGEGILALEGSGPNLDVETSEAAIVLELHHPGAPVSGRGR